MDVKEAINPEWVKKRYPHLQHQHDDLWLCTVCGSNIYANYFKFKKLEQYICQPDIHERALYARMFEKWLGDIGYKLAKPYLGFGKTIEVMCPKGHTFKSTMERMGMESNSYKRCTKCHDYSADILAQLKTVKK